MYGPLIKKIIKRAKREGTIDLSFVDDKTIQALNRKWRGKDKPTDVLSFNYNNEGFLGDVIISAETTKKNAKRYGVPYRDEVKRLVVHGVLHILGYDHGRKMRNAEKIFEKR
ncbi:MAG: rRNA maturation RNase YbeY [bacterium]